MSRLMIDHPMLIALALAAAGLALLPWGGIAAWICGSALKKGCGSSSL